MAEHEGFSIVCVCTGNICRSPAAERLLAHALGPTVTVTSAGSHAMVGQPLSPPMDTLVSAVGAEPEDFAARQLDPGVLLGADLVLAMTRSHRSAVVELAPATVRRCFTLREYARLLGQLTPAELPAGSPAERARASLRPAAARRRLTALNRDDIGDPYRRGDLAYQTAFDEIRSAVEQIAAVLCSD